MRCFSILIAAAILTASHVGTAAAGARHYDVSVLMNEPHPFASGYWSYTEPPQAAPVATPAAPAERTYEQRVENWTNTRGLTMERLVGIVPPTGRPPKVKVAANPEPAPEPPPRYFPDDHRFQFGLGYFDVAHGEAAVEMRAEWHGKKLLWIVRPLAGVMGTTDGSFYSYAGIVFDIFFGKRWVFTPSFAPGIYVQNDGKKLGSPIEFRSMAEIAYKFDSGSRLGLAIYHLSNAGLTQFNPGVEVLTLSYTVPFGNLFR